MTDEGTCAEAIHQLFLSSARRAGLGTTMSEAARASGERGETGERGEGRDGREGREGREREGKPERPERPATLAHLVALRRSDACELAAVRGDRAFANPRDGRARVDA